MSGPGDVIAGLAPPQDNAPARNPSGWPYRQAARGQRKAGRAAGRGERESGEGVPDALDAHDAAVMNDGTGRYGEEWSGASAAGDEAGAGRRFTGDGDSGSGAEGAQEQASTENMNALAGYIRSSWARNKRARDVVEQRRIAALVIVGAFLGEGFALSHVIPAGSEVLAGRVLGTLDSALLAVLYYYFGGSAGSDRKTELLATGQPAKSGT